MTSLSSQDETTSYDQVPYESRSFPETQPDQLATLALIFGMHPAPVAKCRVLELGCARGENLIPLAVSMPNSSFVGVDLSSTQVNYGHDTISHLGLKNISLKHMSIMDVAPSLGTFDYIVVHGIFSWVEKEVQDKILEVCANNLNPNGVAYVSYNTNPGWKMRGMIRDMMLYHSEQFKEPKQFVTQARALLNFMAQSLKDSKSPYAVFVNNELELIRKQPDWYIFHDHLEHTNDPVYFHEFMERADNVGLQFLGDLPFSSMLIDKFSEEVKRTLGKVGSNIVRMEQYKDFLMNRMFRKSLLCHKNIILERNITPEKVKFFWIASGLRPVSASPDIAGTKIEEFKNMASATLKTSDPFLKGVFLSLAETWPAWVSFDKLVTKSIAKAFPGKKIDSEKKCAMEKLCASQLLKGFVEGVVEFHSMEAPFGVEVGIGESPCASSLARLQLESGNIVTNFRHEPVALNDFSVCLLKLMNGSRKVKELLSAFSEDISIKNSEKFKGQEDKIFQNTLLGIAKNALLKQ